MAKKMKFRPSQYDKYDTDKDIFYGWEGSVLQAGFHFMNMAHAQLYWADHTPLDEEHVHRRQNARVLLDTAEYLLNVAIQSGVEGPDIERLGSDIHYLKDNYL